MKYLLEIDGVLYGYDTKEILMVDLFHNNPDKYKIYKRVLEDARIKYKQISTDYLRDNE